MLGGEDTEGRAARGFIVDGLSDRLELDPEQMQS
jgi:hypothetical protein